MAIEGDLERTILKDYIPTWNANVEASLTAKLAHFFNKLLPAVEFALEAAFDIVLETAWVVVDNRSLAIAQVHLARLCLMMLRSKVNVLLWRLL